MAEAAKNREARRRRRILEQGSDRLAFITRRIETLPPHSASSSQPHPLPTTSVDHTHSISPNPQPAPNSIIQTPPQRDGPTHISTISPSVPESESESEALPRQHFQEPNRWIVPSPSDITRAISSSQGTRLCCSILVALIVVLSYSGLGTQFLNTLRPLYLVLLTNLTVVIARLFHAKQVQRRGEYSQLAMTFELCLLAQNVADAVFIDSAVYAVVLVCGLSLLPSPSNSSIRY